MAKIRFTSEFTLANDLRPRVYKRGQEIDTNESTARRYIRRGVAVRIDDPPVHEAGLFASDGDDVSASGHADAAAGDDDDKPKPTKKKRQRIE